jgi:hypothetical protein
MRLRRRSVPLFAFILALLPIAAAPVRAATTCKPVPGIGPQLVKFLGEVASAQAAGRGELPLVDVLFGVTGIGADDQKALDRRVAVDLARRDAAGGDYANLGPEKVTIQGVFAEKETFFRLPAEVRGRYSIGTDGGVTLTYDPRYTVELGERHVGVLFFKGTHHTVITRDGLAFFLDKNAGPDPDRCYRAVAG